MFGFSRFDQFQSKGLFSVWSLKLGQGFVSPLMGPSKGS
jgi:hypothetical protein